MTVGLLTSQIGHDLGDPVRAVWRSPAAPDGPLVATVLAADGTVRGQAPCRPWGRLWGAHWSVAECGALPEGAWTVVLSGDGCELGRRIVDVAPHRLWRETWRLVALEQLERRTRIAGLGHGTGWQDCGCDWQEVNSHAACITGLCDLMPVAAMSESDRARTAAQIRVGCRLLDRMQDEAPAAGLGDGALIHEHRRARRPLVRDAVWAALAWARAARALGGAEGQAWRQRARRALGWWGRAQIEHAGMDPVAHGWPAGYVPPCEHPTIDLALAAWAWLELAESPGDEAGVQAIALAGRVLDLQVARGPAGPWGHFWEFPDRHQAAPVWTHNNIGPDTGDVGVSPAWAIAGLLRRWPDHPQAGRWRDALTAHADGWLVPMADASPFAISARAWRGGWIHFTGLWHGMNAVYAMTAALCDDLAGLLGRPDLRPIAHANRQWIAGLNIGLTAAARNLGCHMTWPEADDAVARPVAMIQGCGRSTAAGWMGIPGTIPNGFSAGDQFRFDVPADAASDASTSFTDEDWIVHAGAWLMAVARVAG